jgi:glycosyltransferase involved in cell wall biosynthesis
MSQMDEPRPLRVLFVGEGVLGHRTQAAQLQAALAGNPAVDARFVTVPPPSRLGRLMLRRWRRIGDGDFFGLRWRLRWSWQARRLLKRHGTDRDVAMITTQASALLSRGIMRRLPCVLSVDAALHQFTALEYGGPLNRWSTLQDRILFRLERRAIDAAATVVAGSDWNAEELQRDYGLGGERLATIHPGLDADWWGEAAKRRESGRAGPLRVLFVGNGVRRKGLDLLIEATSRTELDVVLDVVSGDEVEETDSVRVHRGIKPNSEELRDLYAAADVFALPTRADAIPWVVVEAMAAGLPAVASRVGAIPELIGDSGLIIEPGNVDELAAALTRLSDGGRRESLSARALTRVRERYDRDIQVPRLLEVLFKAAGRSNPDTGGPRMKRRTFVALGAGAAGVVLAAPYLVLLPSDEFEEMVGSKLGIEPPLARQLLEGVRNQYGDAEYEARAAAFAFAVRDPAATVMPDSLRQKAVSSFVEPMFSRPAANLGYAITGAAPPYPAPCAGLVRAE